MTIVVTVSLDNHNKPKCSPDPVTVTNAGATVIKWQVATNSQITAITAISGLPGTVFNPPPQAQAGNPKAWTSTDNAHTTNNGTYKYDISVQLSNGSIVTQDPEVINDVNAK